MATEEAVREYLEHEVPLSVKNAMLAAAQQCASLAPNEYRLASLPLLDANGVRHWFIGKTKIGNWRLSWTKVDPVKVLQNMIGKLGGIHPDFLETVQAGYNRLSPDQWLLLGIADKYQNLLVQFALVCKTDGSRDAYLLDEREDIQRDVLFLMVSRPAVGLQELH